MYNQREVILVPFPYTDLSSSKMRPALIISNDDLNKSDDRLCCLITSVPSKEGILIKRKFFEEGKLPFRSWVKPHRIFSIDTKIVKRVLCKLDEKFHDEVLSRILEYVR